MSVLLALLAAVAFAVASTAQHRVAARVDGSSEPSGSFIRRLATDRQWLIGTSFDIVAVVLQASALKHGQLSLVQPILTVGLVFALAFNAALDGRQLRPAEWGGAAAIGVGVSAFALSTQPHGGSNGAPGARWVTILMCSALAVSALVAWSRSPRARAHRASALALAAGIVFGVVAALTKAALGLLSISFERVATSWQPYALFVLALIGLTLSQRAFQAAPLSVSLPILTIADPIVGAAVGVGLFREQLALGGWSGAVAVGAIAAMCVGIVTLARSPHGNEGERTVVNG